MWIYLHILYMYMYIYICGHINIQYNIYIYIIYIIICGTTYIYLYMTSHMWHIYVDIHECLVIQLYVCLYDDRVALPKGTNQNLSMRSLQIQ
jgi:hypothetical protein